MHLKCCLEICLGECGVLTEETWRAATCNMIMDQ
jgi:hypothetical protein